MLWIGRASAADGDLCRSVSPDGMGRDGASRVTWCPRASSLAMRRRVSRSGPGGGRSGAEFLVGGAGGQDVPDDDEDGVGDDDDGLVLRGGVLPVAAHVLLVRRHGVVPPFELDRPALATRPPQAGGPHLRSPRGNPPSARTGVTS